ncbi:MAG: DUF4136 domain-containing protein [Acidiferrobacterales bacterium]
MWRLLPASLLAALAGCSTITVSTDHDREANFSALTSYAWMPPPAENPTARFDEQFVRERVHAAVDRELTAKGYRKQPKGSGTPDFLIVYYAALVTKMRATTVTVGYGYSMGWGSTSGAGGTVTAAAQEPRGTVYEYEEGSLVIDIVNARTRKLMWRGSAQSKIDDQAPREKNAALIDEAVLEMLKRFPPQ